LDLTKQLRQDVDIPHLSAPYNGRHAHRLQTVPVFRREDQAQGRRAADRNQTVAYALAHFANAISQLEIASVRPPVETEGPGCPDAGRLGRFMTFIKRLILAGIVAGAIPAMGGCGGPPTLEDGMADPVGVTSESLVSALTSAESRQVLKLIDDICGDTWCEGDNDFSFDRLACSARTHRCTLVFDVIPRDDVAGGQPSYRRSCTTHHFTGFDSLVTTTESGYQSLAPAYYDALTACISRVEDSLR
jgi:hypothetical protein